MNGRNNENIIIERKRSIKQHRKQRVTRGGDWHGGDVLDGDTVGRKEGWEVERIPSSEAMCDVVLESMTKPTRRNPFMDKLFMVATSPD